MKIIILNGSRNSGKTTTGTALSEMLPRTAFVDIDVMRDFVKFLSLKKSIPLNLENAVLIVKNLIKKNFNVVLVYPLYKKEIDYLKRGLISNKTKIYLFTLKPNLKTALSNRGRKITTDDKKRIVEQYGTGGECYGKNLGVVINNTNNTPSETAKMILGYVKKSPH